MKIVTIGRDENNNVVIDDPLVTRMHCQIASDNHDGFYLIDNNSTNGTFVNGMRVSPGVKTALNRTDIIRIGNTTLPWRSYFGQPGTQMAPENNGNNVNNVINIGVATPPVASPNPVPVGKPDNFLVWAILGTIFCCVPFGIASIVNASKVDGLWRSGDYEGAVRAAKNARKWFWWGFWLGILCLIINIVRLLIQANVRGF